MVVDVRMAYHDVLLEKTKKAQPAFQIGRQEHFIEGVGVRRSPIRESQQLTIINNGAILACGIERQT